MFLCSPVGFFLVVQGGFIGGFIGGVDGGFVGFCGLEVVVVVCVWCNVVSTVGC